MNDATRGLVQGVRARADRSVYTQLVYTQLAARSCIHAAFVTAKRIGYVIAAQHTEHNRFAASALGASPAIIQYWARRAT